MFLKLLDAVLEFILLDENWSRMETAVAIASSELLTQRNIT